MIPIHYFLALCLMMLVWLCLGLYWGYRYAIHHHQIESIEGIRKYINDHFSTEWDAYQLGYAEGYALGTRDGKEPPI